MFSTRLFYFAVFLIAGASTSFAAPGDGETTAWPFGVVAAGIKNIDDADRIGMANARVGILIRKRDNILLGIWPASGNNLIATSVHSPLWSLEIIPDGASDPVVMNPAETKPAKFLLNAGDHEETLTGIYETTAPGGVSCAVKMQVHLRDDSPTLHWRLESIETKGAKLWSAKFPQISIAGSDSDPAGNRMVIPYRRGEERPFGKAAPKSEVSLPYPGPAAKFQFMATYHKTAGRGLYYAVEDGAGFSKVFWLTNSAASNAITFNTEHFPENRGASVRSWKMPYEIATEPFTGDWWDAARIYRQWWVKQIWASKGLIEQRADVPDWLKRSSIAVRFHTGPHRTLDKNLAGLRALDDALKTTPFIGTWYDYTLPPEPEKIPDNNFWGHGHLLPPQPGVVDALSSMKSRGIYWMAYIQSIIYVSSFPGDDRPAAEAAATRDPQNHVVTYPAENDHGSLWAMCRANEWWQNRIVEQCRKAVGETGFSGVYLDSFGKGADECFAPNHNHPLGGGNTIIAGQRAMAQRIRSAIREQNPQAIMAGEDPIEAFRDLLDIHLYSVNISKNYVPIYRTVWGDYSLGHGRTIGPAKDPRCVIPEIASLFLEGTIIGRFPLDSGEIFIATPQYEKTLGFLKTVLAYTPHSLPYLRFGEYLHPLQLTPALSTIQFKESTRGQLVTLPAVLHSVTRSHSDGSVAIAMINISGQMQKLAVPIDPDLRGWPLRTAKTQAALFRMNVEGHLDQLQTGEKPWAQPIELQPSEIAILVVR